MDIPFGQEWSQNIPKPSSGHSQGNVRISPEYYWINFADAVDLEFGGISALWSMLVWPDSNVVIVSDDNTRYYDIHGAAQVFDPVSNIIANYVNSKYNLFTAKNWFTRYQSFLVDSIRFGYLYQNKTGITDTLKVYIIKPGSSSLSTQLLTNKPTQGETLLLTILQYDYLKNQPLGSNIEEITILLNQSDTISLPSFQFISLPVNITIPPDISNSTNKIGLAVHFIPGQSYNPGDTLLDQRTNKTPLQQELNKFRLIMGEEEYSGASRFPVSYTELTWNQGNLATKGVRYDMDTNGFSGKYISSFAFSSEMKFEHIYAEWHTKPFGASYQTDITPCVNKEINFTDESNINPTNWLWNFGDGVISNIQHPAHTFTTPGAFNICLTSWNQIDSFKFCKKYDVDWCTGIEDYQNEGVTSIVLSPNPVKDVITIEFSNHRFEPSQILLFDISGKCIKRYDLLYQSKQYTIPLHDLSSGVYILYIKGNEGIYTEKLVISR